MTTLGEAFIEVHADCKPFARELAECVKAATIAAGKKVDPEALRTGQRISEKISQGVDKDSNKINRSFRKIGKKIKVEADDWAKKLRAPFEKLAKGNFILTRLFGEFVLAVADLTAKFVKLGLVTGKLALSFVKLFGAFGNVAIAGFKALLGLTVDFTATLGSFQKALGNVFVAFTSFIAAIGEMLAVAAPAAAAVILVVGAIQLLAGILVVIIAPFATLLNLALAFPAALTLILGIILPLVVGLHNLGDAMKAVFEKDPKKFAEEFKALSPVMQGLVSALRPLRGLFNKMRDSVQAGLIGPILTQLQPVLRRLLPVLSASFTAVAQAIGNIALGILRIMGSQAFLDIIQTTMGQIALFLQNSAPIISQLILGFGQAAQGALPTVLLLVDKFLGFMSKFATWINDAINDGRFQKWLDTAVEDLDSIVGLIGAIIDLFASMFSQTDEGGRKFLDKITKTIQKITTWINSPEGKQAMKDLVQLALDFADALETTLKLLKDNLIVVLAIYHTFQGIAETIQWIENHWPGNKAVGGVRTGLGKKVGKKQFVGGHSFSGGGVVPEDELAFVHRGEPILDPANSVARNRSILADAGMLGLLEPAPPVVNVYVGNEQLDARTDYRIAKANRSTARTLVTGARI